MNIGYHTRLHANNTVKVCGGSFGGSLDVATANRLVKSMFTVRVLNSGRPVFVDRMGREVSLYVSVDPQVTDLGKAALAEHCKVRRLAALAEKEKEDRVRDLLDNMTTDEALRLLTAGGDE